MYVALRVGLLSQEYKYNVCVCVEIVMCCACDADFRSIPNDLNAFAPAAPSWRKEHYSRVPILERHLPWAPFKKNTSLKETSTPDIPSLTPALPSLFGHSVFGAGGWWTLLCGDLPNLGLTSKDQNSSPVLGGWTYESRCFLTNAPHVDLFIQMMFSFLIHPPFLKQTWKSWKQLCILWKMSSLSPRWSFSTSKMCEDMAIGFGQFFGHKTKLCTVSIANFWKTAVAWSHSISHFQTDIFVNRWYSKPFWNTTKHRSYSNLLSNGKFETWTSKKSDLMIALSIVIPNDPCFKH